MTPKPADVSRLIITRRIGESFLVGDTHKVTLLRNQRGLYIKVETPAGGKTTPIRPDQPVEVMPNVVVELRKHRPDANATYRVMVLAPRNIKIIRTELLAEQ